MSKTPRERMNTMQYRVAVAEGFEGNLYQRKKADTIAAYLNLGPGTYTVEVVTGSEFARIAAYFGGVRLGTVVTR